MFHKCQLRLAPVRLWSITGMSMHRQHNNPVRDRRKKKKKQKEMRQNSLLLQNALTNVTQPDESKHTEPENDRVTDQPENSISVTKPEFTLTHSHTAGQIQTHKGIHYRPALS